MITFSRPTYDSITKQYICVISNGLRYSIECDEQKGFEAPTELKESCVSYILSHTKPFFSKPLQQSVVSAKLQLQFAPEQSETTPHSYEFIWKTLKISQQAFVCCFELVSKKVLGEIDISFDEPAAPALHVPQSIPPISQPAQPTELTLEEESIDTLPLDTKGPITLSGIRALEREQVRRARLRAAKALLRSEQLLSAYLEKYGGGESEFESDSESDA